MKLKSWARNVLILIVALSFASVVSIAQDTPTKASGDDGKSVSVTGCLQKGDEAGEYSLTGEDGKS